MTLILNGVDINWKTTESALDGIYSQTSLQKKNNAVLQKSYGSGIIQTIQ